MAKRIFQNIPAEEADKFIPKGYNSHLYCLRHSAAHVMAQAVCAHFAKAGLVKMGGGLLLRMVSIMTSSYQEQLLRKICHK